GRNILRAIIESGRTDLKVVAINDLAPVDNLAYLLQYDSVHGRFPTPVTTTDGSISIGEHIIPVTAERDPAELDWGGVDVALECTGIFKDRDAAGKYLTAGADKVLISAPGKAADRTVVFGVNDGALRPNDRIVSNASCTTNCLAPVAQAIHQAFGIEDGLVTTVHAYTGSQPTLDRGAKAWERGRAAGVSMVPTSTGAAKAVGLVLPELDGRLNGFAIRVPTPNVSCIDFTFTATKPLDRQAINHALADMAAQVPTVLGTSDAPLVSIDLNHDPRSAVVALPETHVQGRIGRVLAWYDNEWGFSNRMGDVASVMGALQ
ncbi:MAG: type I glyceraldehyde-3-phosphate dehydrogenase, partial [Pseudomonadota bacterium]